MQSSLYRPSESVSGTRTDKRTHLHRSTRNLTKIKNKTKEHHLTTILYKTKECFVILCRRECMDWSVALYIYLSDIMSRAMIRFLLITLQTARTENNWTRNLLFVCVCATSTLQKGKRMKCSQTISVTPHSASSHRSRRRWSMAPRLWHHHSRCPLRHLAAVSTHYRSADNIQITSRLVSWQSACTWVLERKDEVCKFGNKVQVCKAHTFLSMRSC